MNCESCPGKVKKLWPVALIPFASGELGAGLVKLINFKTRGTMVKLMSEAYNTLPPRYAESLLYIDLVDVLSAYRRISKLSTICGILGTNETSLSKYMNGRMRPRLSKSLSMIKTLTDINLVKKVVFEYLRSGSMLELLMDVPLTKLIALSIIGRLVKVFHGSRVETLVTSSEALLIASHVSHRLRSALINIHTIKGGYRTRRLGNTAVILVLADDETVRQLIKLKSEGRGTDIKYIFSVIYSKEIDMLASAFSRATIDYLIGAVP